jgi:hypothetical protein
MITYIIISVLIIASLSYVAYNLFRKVETLEKIVDSQDQYINKFSNTVDYTSKKLQDIDEKGSFQSDDEIGWFFESVKTLQRELDDFNIKSTPNIGNTTPDRR